MGIHRDNGYSAIVSAFFAAGGEQFALAKTNGASFVLAESQELAPGTEGDLVVVVDGEASSRRVTLPDGAILGETTVGYRVVAPF
jgi:hypothetical protein